MERGKFLSFLLLINYSINHSNEKDQIDNGSNILDIALNPQDESMFATSSLDNIIKVLIMFISIILLVDIYYCFII